MRTCTMLVRDMLRNWLGCCIAAVTCMQAEGGLGEVDVRLMPTTCHITLRAVKENKHLHDTFLRQGELQAVVTDADGAWDGFSRCVDQLELKLKPW